MSFTLDPGVAAALAPMGEAMAATTPPAVGDIAGRRALWEPVLAAASGTLDVFRDEDISYAAKLSRAGVAVEFHLHPGVPHEFDSIAPESGVARPAVALAPQLHHPSITLVGAPNP